ncbi:MAG TPA: T9SS type A sorting domain-containing protein [Saprospiraceae bacterium]|nr:T9SS type A sorting domain-containing protein [Saprospiraceae bacterium]
MKKLIFLFLMLIALAPAQAQLEWAPVGAKYYHSVADFMPGGSSAPYSVHVSEVMGDTVIGGKNCRILMTISPACSDGFPIRFTYEEEGRVYFYDTFNEAFNLLYDFNKGPGESWSVPICFRDFHCERDSIMVLVDSVTHTPVNGLELRTQHVSIDMPGFAPGAYPQGEIYQGIGNAPVLYFYFGACALTVDFFIHTFNCYESPTHGIFNFVGGQPCGVYTATGEAQAAVEQLRLYPNPAREWLNVELPQGGRGQLALYNAQGRLLKTQSLDTAQEAWPLDVSALPAGMYLLLYRSEGGAMALGKFVRE